MIKGTNLNQKKKIKKNKQTKIQTVDVILASFHPLQDNYTASLFLSAGKGDNHLSLFLDFLNFSPDAIRL